MADKCVVGYDFTLPFSKFDKLQCAAMCKEWFTKFVFQLEESDSGYVHWQGRGYLIKKRRLNELKGKAFVGGHLSITSEKVHQSNSFNYVMKADTRKEGPFTEKDFEDPPVLTRQLVIFNSKEHYGWQKSVFAFTD